MKIWHYIRSHPPLLVALILLACCGGTRLFYGAPTGAWQLYGTWETRYGIPQGNFALLGLPIPTVPYANCVETLALDTNFVFTQTIQVQGLPSSLKSTGKWALEKRDDNQVVVLYGLIFLAPSAYLETTHKIWRGKSFPVAPPQGGTPDFHYPDAGYVLLYPQTRLDGVKILAFGIVGEPPTSEFVRVK